jgi:hypothetical protein
MRERPLGEQRGRGGGARPGRRRPSVIGCSGAPELQIQVVDAIAVAAIEVQRRIEERIGACRLRIGIRLGDAQARLPLILSSAPTRSTM